MKKYIVKCTEEINYEFIIEANSESHAKEVFYTAGRESIENHEGVTGADFNINSVTEVS